MAIDIVPLERRPDETRRLAKEREKARRVSKVGASVAAFVVLPAMEADPSFGLGANGEGGKMGASLLLFLPPERSSPVCLPAPFIQLHSDTPSQEFPPSSGARETLLGARISVSLSRRHQSQI